MKILCKLPLPQYDIDDVLQSVYDVELDCPFIAHRCIADTKQDCIDYLSTCCQRTIKEICLPCGRIVFFGCDYGHLGKLVDPNCNY